MSVTFTIWLRHIPGTNVEAVKYFSICSESRDCILLRRLNKWGLTWLVLFYQPGLGLASLFRLWQDSLSGRELCYLGSALCVWDAEVFTGEFGALGDRKTLKLPLALEP